MRIFLIELYEPRTAEIKPGFLHPVVVGGFIFHPHPETWAQVSNRSTSPTSTVHTPLPGLGLNLTFQLFAVSSSQLEIPADVIT